MAREFFDFGAASKKFSRRNEKVLAPFFRKTGTRNERVLVRKMMDGSQLDKRDGTAFLWPLYPFPVAASAFFIQERS
nr:hypothetical protein [Porphyromonas gulae]